jgi:hypothetical protein
MRGVVRAAVALSVLLAGALAPAPAEAVGPTLGQVAISGLHNTYQRSAYAHLSSALARQPGMIEIDVWTTFSSWTVAHDQPFWNDNNCTSTSGAVNQGLRTCVDNIAAWHNATPTHKPLLIKLELKAGAQCDISLIGLAECHIGTTPGGGPRRAAARTGGGAHRGLAGC